MDQSEAQRGHGPIDPDEFRANLERIVAARAAQLLVGAGVLPATSGLPVPDLSPLVPDPEDHLREAHMRGRLLALVASGQLRRVVR